MSNWKHVIAGYCIVINVFLALFGILINDVYTVLLALGCIMLVSLPIVIQESYEKEDEKEDDSK